MQSSFLKLLTRELLATTNTMRIFAQFLLFYNLLSCLNSTMLAKYAAIGQFRILTVGLDLARNGG